MMGLLLPERMLGGYGGDPDGVSGSWEKACTYVSVTICVRVAFVYFQTNLGTALLACSMGAPGLPESNFATKNE